jgi:transmembrane protein TMEM260 (protein O-mannosyltransferase)
MSTYAPGSGEAVGASDELAGPRASRRAAWDARLLTAWIAAVGVGGLALGLCVWRLMPGLGFWDTAEFQTALPVMGTVHPTGYPTYVLVGWLASVLLQPLGEPALRMNVLSAILVAVGAAVSTDLARRLTGSVALAVAAGVGIALTPIIWAIGTHADPHALHFALVAIILWLLVRWEQARRGSPMDATVEPLEEPRRADRLLLAAAVVTGLAVGNHSLTLLLGPGILVFVLAVEPGIVRRPRFVLANLAAFVIPTVLVRFEMVLRAGWLRAPFVYADPSTWVGFWYVTLGAQFHGWVTDPFADIPGRFEDLARMAIGQLGPFAPVVVVAFVVTAIRLPRYAALSGLTLALTCFFNSVYPDGAIDRYYIGPALIAWTWLAVLAATFVQAMFGVPGDDVIEGDAGGRRRDDRSLGRSVAMAIAAVILVVPSLLAFNVRSQLVDESHDTLAQQWTDEVLGTLAKNAVVVSWWSYSTPLWYATIVDGRRPDISIIDDRTRLDCNLGELDHVIDLYLPTRPVYLIRNGDSELPALLGRFQLVPVNLPFAANLIQVVPVAGGEAQPGSAGPPPSCEAIL